MVPAALCRAVWVGPFSESLHTARCQFGKTKVQHLHKTVRTEHDVLGFQIAVNDSGAVGSNQSRCNLNRYVERLTHGKRCTAQVRTKRFAFDELHRKVLGAGVCLADRVDVADVGMIQR